MKNLIHIASVKDGAIVHFPHSVCEYMKVCDKNGIGGVVRLPYGRYINTRDLNNEGLGMMCEIIYEDLDEIQTPLYQSCLMYQMKRGKK